MSNDVSKDPYYKDIISDATETVTIGSEMAAPLMIKDTLIGVLDVMSSNLSPLVLVTKQFYRCY